jgi:hypothetical protein
MEDNLDPDGTKEHQESIVVLNSHTVVDPWAMVVESLNTLVADSTVS